jgi:hypothetical protein
MSLDVWLTLEGHKSEPGGSGIFVREAGRTVEVTRAEWDEKFPGREPVAGQQEEDCEVYWGNITHNLVEMAKVADIYKCLWRPQETGITHAHQMIQPLRDGLARLEDNPQEYKKLNPQNGWGDYDGFVNFVFEYLQACEKFPQAVVKASR